jgi:tetratricopeptide (TPR) repeat protein
MNRNDFLRMIENSGPADHLMIREVGELINIFPYFQSAYMLMLKGLQNTADVKFENQLKTSAMHIADREVLYYFLKKETAAEKATELQPPAPPYAESEKTESQQTVIEQAKNSADLINEIEKSTDENKTDDRSRDHSVLITAQDDFENSDAAIMIIDEESGAVEEKIFYMDPGFSVSEREDLLELDINAGSVPPTDENVIFTKQKTVSGELPTKQLQADLIDKFIKANPRIEPVKERSGITNEDISKPFVEEREGFLTETLARIYIKQGYYSRAIDIYEKLSLKFPEKSSYFASQIEKVKELIKK